MKKIIFVLTAILLVFTSVFFGCGEKPEEPPTEPPPSAETPPPEQPPEDSPSSGIYFSVTFKQEGLDDIVKSVEQGKTLLDVPTPNAKKGYNVSWSITDFSNVLEDLIVNAVYTVKRFVVKFDCSIYPGLVGPSQIFVTYGDNYELEPLVLDVGEFIGWEYNGNQVEGEGVWDIDGGSIIVLRPIIQGGYYKVTFSQEAKGATLAQSKTVYVKHGEGVLEEDVPTPVPTTGYEVCWDYSIAELQNVTEDLTVSVVYTPKNYLITYELNGGKMDGGLSVEQTVTYGSVVTLQTASKEGFVFRGWAYLGKILSDFEYLYDYGITVTAVWEAEL